jgi:hypothetical protein
LKRHRALLLLLIARRRMRRGKRRRHDDGVITLLLFFFLFLNAQNARTKVRLSSVVLFSLNSLSEWKKE